MRINLGGLLSKVFLVCPEWLDLMAATCLQFIYLSENITWNKAYSFVNIHIWHDLVLVKIPLN
jgi:hypothetical protein